MTDKKPSPRIYVADLAAYNAGTLRGVSIELFEGITGDEIQFAIDAMLKESSFLPAEEWRIDDYEDMPNLGISDLDQIAAIANLVHEHGVTPVRLFAEHYGADYVTVERFADAYKGCYKSLEAFAEELLVEAGVMAELEKMPVPYLDSQTMDMFVDLERIGSDLTIDPFWVQQRGLEEFYVFVNE